MSGSRSSDSQLPPELCAAVYTQLRQLAGFYLAGRGGRGTVLQATSLVHEAFVRLARSGQQQWESHTHFAAVAATVMRRVLIDELRARARERRSDGDVESVQVDSGDDGTLDLLALDDALTQLAALSERQARIVELRYFGGLTVPEAAGILGVSPRTVENDWSIARAWLRAKLEHEQ